MGSIQRGGMVAKNDNGTLERVDGTNTYIGSATLQNGKVITKRFRGVSQKQDKIIESWERWQCRNDVEEDVEKEEVMAEIRNTKKNECPLSGNECGPACPLYSQANKACSLKLGGIGLYNMSCNLMNLKVDEELELIALAIAESKTASEPAREPVAEAKPKAKTEAEGVDAFLDGKKFLDFVNLGSKRVYSDYKKTVEGKGYPIVKEADLIAAITKRFPELKKKGVHGGSVLVAA